MGEVADYDAKTVKCRSRHVDKLKAYYDRARDPAATFADLFGLYGMLYYMSDTLGLPVDRHLSTRLFFSSLARRLAGNVSLWNLAAHVTLPADDVAAWVAEALENRPAALLVRTPPDTIVFGDACRLGYAGVVVHRDGNGDLSTTLLQSRWESGGALDYGHSTISEPEAAVRLLHATSQLHRGAHTIYVTDHAPFVSAHERGYSIAPHYNSCVGRILDRHPEAFLVFQPGETMVADKYSRFEASTLTVEDREAAEASAAAIFGGNMGETAHGCDVGSIWGEVRIKSRRDGCPHWIA